jgi:hypothetical protein
LTGLAGGGVLDSFVIGHIPSDVGQSVSDFTYEPEDGITFTSRVWERQTDEGSAVDLTVSVIRGDQLTTLDQLRDFMAGYHERDPNSWTDVQIGPHPGLKDTNQAFWLVEPSVALSVTLDTDRFGEPELLTVAEAICTHEAAQP